MIAFRIRRSILAAVAGVCSIVGSSAGQGLLDAAGVTDSQPAVALADDLGSSGGIGIDAGQAYAIMESQTNVVGAPSVALGGFRPFGAPRVPGFSRRFGGSPHQQPPRSDDVPKAPEPPSSGVEGPAAVERWRELARRAADGTVLSANLILSVIRKESQGNPRAVSSAGAQGLMQLMPRTAQNLGVTDSFDPWQNVRGGTRHLNWLANYYDGNLEYALAAYNYGHGAINNALERGSLPAGAKLYAQTVLTWYQELGGASSGR